MADALPPPREYIERISRLVVPHMVKRGVTSDKVKAGCARCQACSGLQGLERAASQVRKMKSLAEARS